MRYSYDFYLRDCIFLILTSLIIFAPHRTPYWERTGFYVLDFSRPELSCIIHHLQGFIIKVLHKGLSCKTPRDVSGLQKRFYMTFGSNTLEEKCVLNAAFSGCLESRWSFFYQGQFILLIILWALASPTYSFEAVWSPNISSKELSII